MSVFSRTPRRMRGVGAVRSRASSGCTAGRPGCETNVGVQGRGGKGQCGGWALLALAPAVVLVLVLALPLPVPGARRPRRSRSKTGSPSSSSTTISWRGGLACSDGCCLPCRPGSQTRRGSGKACTTGRRWVDPLLGCAGSRPGRPWPPLCGGACTLQKTGATRVHAAQHVCACVCARARARLHDNHLAGTRSRGGLASTPHRVSSRLASP